MKIAVTAKKTENTYSVDGRFGRAEAYAILDGSGEEELQVIPNEEARAQAHGAGPKAAQAVFDTGAAVLITGGRPGGNAAAVLKKGDIEVFLCEPGLSVLEAVHSYKNGELEKLL